jgi:hypothetical protein
VHWLTGWGITLYRSWRVQKRIYGGDGVRFTSAFTAQGRPAHSGTAASRSGHSSERFKSPTGRTTSREATLSSVRTNISRKGAADTKRATKRYCGQANRSTGTEAASRRRGCREDRHECAQAAAGQRDRKGTDCFATSAACSGRDRGCSARKHQRPNCAWSRGVFGGTRKGCARPRRTVSAHFPTAGYGKQGGFDWR